MGSLNSKTQKIPKKPMLAVGMADDTAKVAQIVDRLISVLLRELPMLVDDWDRPYLEDPLQECLEDLRNIKVRPNGDHSIKSRADVLTVEKVSDIISELSGKVI